MPFELDRLLAILENFDTVANSSALESVLSSSYVIKMLYINAQQAKEQVANKFVLANYQARLTKLVAEYENTAPPNHVTQAKRLELQYQAEEELFRVTETNASVHYRDLNHKIYVDRWLRQYLVLDGPGVGNNQPGEFEIIALTCNSEQDIRKTINIATKNRAWSCYCFIKVNKTWLLYFVDNFCREGNQIPLNIKNYLNAWELSRLVKNDAQIDSNYSNQLSRKFRDKLMHRHYQDQRRFHLLNHGDLTLLRKHTATGSGRDAFGYLVRDVFKHLKNIVESIHKQLPSIDIRANANPQWDIDARKGSILLFGNSKDGWSIKLKNQQGKIITKQVPNGALLEILNSANNNVQIAELHAKIYKAIVDANLFTADDFSCSKLIHDLIIIMYDALINSYMELISLSPLRHQVARSFNATLNTEPSGDKVDSGVEIGSTRKSGSSSVSNSSKRPSPAFSRKTLDRAILDSLAQQLQKTMQARRSNGSQPNSNIVTSSGDSMLEFYYQNLTDTRDHLDDLLTYVCQLYHLLKVGLQTNHVAISHAEGSNSLMIGLNNSDKQMLSEEHTVALINMLENLKDNLGLIKGNIVGHAGEIQMLLGSPARNFAA